MATTIVPGTGAGVIFTQTGTGTTPGYSALDVRRAIEGPMQEGVLNASDFMVVQRGAGANLSVDVGMPAGGGAYVQGDTVNGQGLYRVPVHSATVNEVITTANGSNPRIDSIILEIQDTTLDGSGGNLARTRVLTGTATSGATLANRTGAASLPGNALLLADVLVPASDTTIDNTQIRDRRKWARGAYWRFLRSAGDYSLSSASAALIDSTNLQPRIECSGVPLRIQLRGRWQHANLAAVNTIGIRVDGVAADGGDQTIVQQPVAGASMLLNISWDTVPAVGSHLVAPYYLTSSASLTIFGSASQPLIFTVEEIARQNAVNNSVTTG